MTSRSTVGGRLDPSALSALAGNRDHNRMHHFDMLTPFEKKRAIQRLSADGMSDHGISKATGLSVEMVRRLLADRS